MEGARDVKLLGIAARRLSDHGTRTQRLGCQDLVAGRPIADHDGRTPSRGRWQVATLAECWVNAGGDATAAGFMRDAEGCIRLRGQLRRAPSAPGARKLPLVVFNLPEGYRPAHRHQVPVLSRGRLGALEVRVGGDVVLVKGAIEELSLDGVVVAEEPGA
jgi:hypothetical protein